VRMRESQVRQNAARRAGYLPGGPRALPHKQIVMNYRRPESGQTVVEFALILPLLIVKIVNAVNFEDCR